MFKLHLLRATPSLYWPEAGGTLSKNIGGVQVQAYRLTKSISRRNITQTVYTKSVIPEEITAADGKVRIVGSGCNPLFPNVRWMLGCIRHVKRQSMSGTMFDGFHVHCDGAVSPILLGLCLKKKWQIPLIYSINCCKQVTYVERYKIERLLRPVMFRLERYCLSRADAIVFSTQAVADKVKQINPELPPDKIYVIGDVIDPVEMTCASRAENLRKFQKKYNLTNDIPVILYVGRIAKEKGWRTFIEIASILKDYNYSFLVCGGGPEFDKMRQMIGKNHLDKRVICTDFITNDQVSCAMSLADLIVIPSQYEEFGSVVLEAGIHKLPVVASNITSFCEILGDGRGELVRTDDTQGFCKAICKLMGDRERRAIQAEALWQFVNDAFTVKPVISRYMQIYNTNCRKETRAVQRCN